ncbi:MAG: chaperone NapD [Rhodoplanes sp.]|uniref:chaperone NapD n=1 Tax=Rhodoplanes sp. TaxID=1968906 RepID=UPI0017C0F37E|nr:chaperone NapD [Rhodoplanes sp.]NVO17231.1 chaperone NapD [Rhodoplanes sp.]
MSDLPTAAPFGLDRRRFLGGGWQGEAAGTRPATIATARVLVQAAPARLDSVADAIAAIAGVRLLTCDPPGRLTTEVSADAVAGALAALAAVPGVLTASVVGASTARMHPGPEAVS